MYSKKVGLNFYLSELTGKVGCIIVGEIEVELLTICLSFARS